MMAALWLLVGVSPLYAAEVTGTLHWVHRVALSTPVSGVVREVRVHAGDRVKKGQLLLSLDQRGFRAAVSKARAEVVKAGGARDEAARELERARQLYDRTLLSGHELQLAKIAAATAAADLESAKADLVRARLNLEYSRVTAPFDAVVLRRSAEVGQTVVTRLRSVSLVTVAEIGRMLARIELDDGALATLKPGEMLAVRVGGRRYRGTLWRIGMEPVGPEGGNARYAVDILFAYPPSVTLRAGERATVELP